MAELHILGHLQSANHFNEPYSLFCQYSFQSGPNWTLIAGYTEGQTASAKANHNNIVEWAHPIDLHYVSKGIQGWPKLILQIRCLDSIGRSWIVGYGTCSIPCSPGLHSVQIACWTPTATTITDRLRQTFLGGSHELAQTDIINLGTDRSKLTTQSKGVVKLSVYLVLRNFCQFGIEYK